MKKLTVLLTLTLTFGCSEVKDLGQGIIDAPSTITKDLLRIDEDDSVDINQQNSLNSLENRVFLLEKVNEHQSNLIEVNSNAITSNSEQIEGVEGIISDLQNQINVVENNLLNYQSTTDAQINAILAQLTNIGVSIDLLEDMSENAISELIDPCGDAPGQFDEVILLLNSGEHVAYFQQGSNRMLTVLPNGSYQTTDSQSCPFKIVGGNYVE